ncbi:MAG TPA: Stp1/IreP family PP2C-type Ser/Thr phosphatase [Acidimicrobiales bacterium]|nr:Stp1/IreP family PP2C-type Ser/Thr phosphatase [Acidimicrobiales bacterium]
MTLLRSGSATDTGRVRSTNQDLSLEDADLFAVADGMGGHAGGEVAARVALQALRVAFGRQPSVDGLRQAVVDANAAVWQQSQMSEELRGMGTTLTAAGLVAGADGRDVVALANVGDSRAYVFSGGRISQITADHSLAEEKVRHGQLTQAEAAVHPHRHILTRALGVAAGVDVDLWELRLRTGDRLLICSDGLTNEVGINQISEVLSSVADPDEAARVLVRTANEHGGSDNITVVVVDVVLGEQGPGADVTSVAPIATPGAAMVVAADPVPWAAAADDAQPMGRAAPADPGPPPGENGPPGAAGATGAVDATAVVAAGRGLVGDETGVVPQWAGPSADDLFVGSGPASGQPGVAVADRAVEAPPDLPPPPEVRPPPPRRETRRERRRRLGVPRRITFRVVGFFLLVAAVVAAGYLFVRWYATDNWFVTVKSGQIVVYQGRPGGLLGFPPKLVDRTGVTTAEVLPIHLSALRSNVEEPTLAAARRYVNGLRQEYIAQQQVRNGGTPGAFQVGPTGAIPTVPSPTTAPPPTAPGAQPTAPPAAPPAAPTTTPTTTPVTTTPTTTATGPTALGPPAGSGALVRGGPGTTVPAT